MKRTLIAAALLLGASQANAAPCALGSLAAYIGLGAGGCEIGANTVFDFTALPVSSGATEIGANTINVIPVPVSPFGFGLDFEVNQQASAGAVFEFVVGYRVQGASISGARVHIAETAVDSDGAVTAIKDICRDGVFTNFAGGGPQSCDGTLLSPALIAFDIGIDSQLFDQQSFPAVGSIAVVDDIVIDGGLGGSAALAVAGNRFAAAAVPVPTTATLLALGVLCFGLTSVRNRRRQ